MKINLYWRKEIRVISNFACASFLKVWNALYLCITDHSELKGLPGYLDATSYEVLLAKCWWRKWLSQTGQNRLMRTLITFVCFHRNNIFRHQTPTIQRARIVSVWMTPQPAAPSWVSPARLLWCSWTWAASPPSTRWKGPCWPTPPPTTPCPSPRSDRAALLSATKGLDLAHPNWSLSR